jgi:hypothetical protein
MINQGLQGEGADVGALRDRDEGPSQIVRADRDARGFGDQTEGELRFGEVTILSG